MAIITQVKLDTSEIRGLVARLTPKRAAYSISRGLNDALRQGRTVALKSMTDRYNIKRFELTKSGMLKMSSAKASNLSASIFADVKRSVALSKFNGLKGDGLTITRKRSKLERGKIDTFIKKGRKAQSGVTRNQERTPVSFEIVKGKRQTLRSGFIAKMKSGHIGVFSRSTSSRGYSGGQFQYREGKGSGGANPIAEHYSFTLHKAMANKYTRQPVETKMQSVVPDRVKYWLNRELKSRG